MICNVCPHYCEIKDQELGKCNIIKQQEGKLINTQYGNVSVLNVSKIEKRPFFHFFPNSNFLSVGHFGCSFSCSFCQNYKVSQQIGVSKYIAPKELSEICAKKECLGICFTFNEPSIHLDYILDVKEHNSMIVLKSNGFMTPETMQSLSFVSAINIDIKGDNKEYERICGGFLDPVLHSIEYFYKNNVHLEISYLVLPRLLNDYDFHEKIRNFISSLSPLIPVHFLYYFPFYKMAEEAYDIHDLVRIIDFFKEKLHFVYLSNYFKSHKQLRNTYCPSCYKLLIDRELNRYETGSCCGLRIIKN